METIGPLVPPPLRVNFMNNNYSLGVGNQCWNKYENGIYHSKFSFTSSKTSNKMNRVSNIVPTLSVTVVISSQVRSERKKYWSTVSGERNGQTLVIFEEKWPNYTAGPKSAPNSDFGVHRIFCAQNLTVFLVYTRS